MPLSSRYDFIFTGAGCAALSIVMRMIKSGKFSDKKILLIDKEPKNKNDRTWCFWEKENGFFDELVFKKWKKLSFFSDGFAHSLDIAPYEYKMIRGIDFYNHCFSEVKKHGNIEIVYGNVQEWSQAENSVDLLMDGKEIELKHAVLFNSIYKPSSIIGRHIKLLQHFKGWVIETASPVFNPDEATLMDFRVSQARGTTFVYVMPFTETIALIEYTLFSKELLQPLQYEDALKNYICDFLKINEYKIKEEEFGIIPMTNEKFHFDAHGWQIGTAGGQTKASSGYTFQFIQKQSQEIVDCLLAGKSLRQVPVTPKRFRFYDNTLLHILYHNQLRGSDIFTTLFKKNKPQQVLKFLDNESTLAGELKIISTLPKLPFLRAALKQL